MSAKASGRRARRQTQLAARRERKRLSSQPQWVVALLLLVFLLSGAAGLIHEVVWMRLLAGVFGATSLAVSTVLAAFMGGLALGSYWIGRRMGQLSDRRRIYALLEIGIGVFALLVPFLLDLVEPLYGWLWRELELGFTVMSVFRFVLVGGLLLVPTAMMGATFPALADYFVGLEGKRLGPQLLYTVNLAGALLGVAAAGFVLMPVVGLWGAIAGGAILNIGVGLAVLGLPLLVQRQEPEAPLEDFQPRPDMLLLAAAFLSGVLSLAAQVAWTRVLILVVGSTTYAFSTVLVVYLLALAAGAAWVTWRWAAVVRVESHLAVIHVLMGLCMLGAIYSVKRLPFWYLDLFSKWQPESLTGSFSVEYNHRGGSLDPSGAVRGNDPTSCHGRCRAPTGSSGGHVGRHHLRCEYGGRHTGCCCWWVRPDSIGGHAKDTAGSRGGRCNHGSGLCLQGPAAEVDSRRRTNRGIGNDGGGDLTTRMECQASEHCRLRDGQNSPPIWG